MTLREQWLDEMNETPRADFLGYVLWLESRIAELEKDRAFYKSCALSGEDPKEGAEPSARRPKEGEQ